ncbi:MFS transporter [Streptomyces lavendulocolor]|uniref:MFS transporter n=1 Tax=Streptomyces lavendulocolor TaxID=67316 RepID=UPI00340D3DEE
MSGGARTAPAPAPTRDFPLRDRDFRLFFAARTVARFGDGMVPVALSAGLVLAGHGVSAVSLALGAWTACFGGFVLFGGVVADRFSPRRVMVLADVLRLVAVAALAAVFLRGDPALWLVYALSAVTGLGAALFQPGIASTIPAIVTDVQRANALLRSSESLMAVIGPVMAGALVGLLGAGGLYALNAATFGVSGLCLFRMRRGPAPSTDAQSMLKELVDGWHEFRGRTWLWATITVWVFYSLVVLGPMVPLQTVLITEEEGAPALGVMMALYGAGSAAGGLVALWLSPRRPLATGAVSLTGVSVHLLALGTGAPLPVLGAAFLVGGAALTFWTVMWATALQTHVPAHAVNRLHAYDVAGSVLTLAAGRALAGPAADWLSTRSVLTAGAVLNCVVVAVLLAVPAVRALPRATTEA